MKNYLIVGGTKGIGRCIAEKFAGNGNYCMVLARNETKFQSDNIHFCTFDATLDDGSDLEIPDTLDGLVYCPGSINLKPFKSLSDAQIIDELQINVLGAVRVIKRCLPALKNSTSSPGILLFSTVAVQQGMPFHASIAMAKGAVEGLTRSLAAELSPNIRVNCIAPSLTDTPLAERLLSTPEKKEAAAARHPLKKLGNPMEIAGIADFLLSDAASWITGQVLHADGGLSAVRV